MPRRTGPLAALVLALLALHSSTSGAASLKPEKVLAKAVIDVTGMT
ncbi:MAG: hypothetical protein HY722_00590 [Planctomycetes bacterium]|nr:hypothetical protein [Planctomycetota bacterium]